MNTILITTSSFGKYNHESQDKITRLGFRYILNPYGRKLTETEVYELIEKYQPIGLIAGVEPLTRSVLEAAKELKVISRCGIGMDNVDLAAAKDMGITVTNTPDAPTIPVAELTLGLILSLLRKIHRSDFSIREQGWERPMGNLLYKKTIGLLGCGRIGSCLATLLEAFQCNILGYDPYPKDNGIIEFVNLENLLSDSDIVSLHMPYTKENHHFIDSSKLNQMKQGAMVINASRGGLVDENALYSALDSGRISGAALDCYENEPYIGELSKFDNVVLTAHIGSYAKEGREMMELQATNNLINTFKEIGVLS